MIYFTLKKYSKIPQDKIYAASIDVKNFSNIMPKYFESISITDSTGNQIIADEMIRFLGRNLTIKTKHVINPPNIHEVHIMSGMTRGSSFIEKYDKTSHGTIVTIRVSINFNGISRIFSPFGFIIKRKMNHVMDEFLQSVENM